MEQTPKNFTCILNKYWPPTHEITVHRTPTKTFASVSNETCSILVTHVLGNKRLNTHKELLPVRPKTAPEIKKKKKKKE